MERSESASTVSPSMRKTKADWCATSLYSKAMDDATDDLKLRMSESVDVSVPATRSPECTLHPRQRSPPVHVDLKGAMVVKDEKASPLPRLKAPSSHGSHSSSPVSFVPAAHTAVVAVMHQCALQNK